ITMDADLQDDPKEIPNLLKKIEEGFDLVSGWKKIRRDPFIKKYSSRLFNFVTALTTGIKIHDFNCGLKAYRKEVVQHIKVYGEMHRYLPVLAHWNGFKVGEIPVQHHPRRYGKTKFGSSRFIKGFLDLVTVLFTTRYMKRPLHFFGTTGMISFSIGLFINLWLTIEWAFFHKYLTNRPMLLFGTLLILLGFQLIAIGLIGEMISHTTQSHEDYHIKSIGI
ncbi:MAG: glycosyltransferase, partial [Ignavibacteria bacterium]|nr:glycosyltransferase [Ignavibacteria bacterium]